ncbi:VCBS repeat-containing protein [Trichlorobacter sp.]|uniref:VCBS repeat-containing protein n=1 Tax=Trichlorobacter sp. TaxID=2911007 RepID=UPI002A35AE53|nr:VCBS repeat-containing protein [Trichlorobacter sp.]MDY0383207.1 VCBS repeat-containing protein [Trichlorobacter sp.]
MKRLLLMLLMLLVSALPALAAGPLRVYVGEFNAVGVAAKDDTKSALQALLASRLNSDRLLTVSSPAEAEVVVGGTYLTIGKQYNLDAFARTAGGQTVSRSFVQGEGGQEALFGAVGSLAEKLSADLLKKVETGSVHRLPVAAPVAAPIALPVVQPRPQSDDIVRPAQPVQSGDLQRAPQGDVIRPQAFYRGAPKSGEIKRLDGMYNLLTPGPLGSDGRRMLFMAQNQSVAALWQGDNRPFTGFGLKGDQKVIGLDYIDSDANGTAELYVTIISQGELESQVWELKNKRLVKLAEKLPYFFRVIALAGGAPKLYLQEQGRGEQQYYGDVHEAKLQGKKVVKQAKIAMPRFGTIHSFNQFKNQNGELMTVVFHEDNYLVVYDKELKEIWRSNDAFGGSELYYQVEDLDRMRTHGDSHRWYFINQRIQVTANQEILVGKNEGFFVIGNARMYKKGAVYSLYWNGAALEEVWRTKDTQSYMPDFWFDEKKSELLLLQLTQREDVLTRVKGASALQIKKVE